MKRGLKKGLNWRHIHFILLGLIILEFIVFSFLNIATTGNPIKTLEKVTATEEAKSSLITVCSEGKCNKAIQKKLNFDSYSLSKQLSKTESKDVVQIPDSYYSEKAGEPMLPFKGASVVIPDGFEIERIDTKADTETLSGNYQVMETPIPTPCCDGKMVPPEYTQSDSSAYSSSDPYPKEIIAIENEGYFGGYKIANLRISPFQYFPLEKKLLHNKNIEFNIILKEIPPTQKHLSNFIAPIVKKTVINPENTETQTVLGGNQAIDYLIITSPSFVSDFNKLAAHKISKGLSAEVISTDWIYSHYSGEDNQAKIRNAIIDYQKNKGTTWVLLGGDEDTVPVRYCYAGYQNAENFSIDQLQICDLYYSDVNGNWDANGNGIYGEFNGDNADLYPDVFLGRIPLGNSADINNYIDKLIAYENNVNAEYSLNVGYLAADQMRDWPNLGQHQLIAATFPAFFKQELIAMAEQPSGGDVSPTQPSGSSVISELSKGYGILVILNHGTPDTIVVRSSGYNNQPRSGIYTFAYSGDSGDLNNLNNLGKAGIVYSVACDNGAFDLDKWSQGANTSITEVFLKLNNKGAVSMIANSRWGWVSSSYKLTKNFFSYMFNTSGADHIGVAQVLSKTSYIGYRDLQMGLNLYGDPEMNVKIQCIPDSASTTCGSWVCGTKTNNCGQTVNCGSCAGALVCNEGVCSASCSDSDGGRVYDAPGTVTVKNISGTYTFNDACSSPYILKEYYCNGNQAASGIYSCSLGCLSGACKKTTVTRCYYDKFLQRKVCTSGGRPIEA